jgi:serine/threonine-protein kinase
LSGFDANWLRQREPFDLAARSDALARAFVGRSIGGCRLVRLVGTGGMGAVFEAEQEDPSRRVAVKLLRSELATGSALRRFQLEAELMSRLEHPSIARIYAAGTHRAGVVHDAEDGAQGSVERPGAPAPYLVMEFIDGARPITRFAQDHALAPADIVRLFAEVVDAIAYGHARGVIHRDLKPSNIMRRPPEATAHLLRHEALLTAGRKAVDQICFIDFELSGLHYRG